MEMLKIQNNSVSRVTGYELDKQGSIPDMVRNFSLHQHVQAGSAFHLIS
jgi:hypothetical protein